MIINTGMRTDIPAFYSKWFLNRLKAGFVLVRNPYDATQVTRYRLSPDVVDLIGFCTKNPIPMLPHMDVLRYYGQYWFVTITPYGKEIEPHVPPKRNIMGAFKRLSRIVGIDSVGWRYDPIFLNKKYTAEYHLQVFEKMAAELAGYTRTCVISFIDLYAKVKKNFTGVRSVEKNDRLKLGKAMIEIGRRYGMTIKPCAEGDELAPFGADCSGCMTINTYETALHRKLKIPHKLQENRSACGCYLACDIGAYNTCGHLCKYCYANYSSEIVHANMAKHDPKSPFLIGHALPGDKIHEAEQKSWLDRQLSLF